MDVSGFDLDGIGARIQERRKGAGYSQASLAAAIGRDESTVRNWESGRTRPEDILVLARLAAALGVSIGWLVGEQGTTRFREGVMAALAWMQVSLAETSAWVVGGDSHRLAQIADGPDRLEARLRWEAGRRTSRTLAPATSSVAPPGTIDAALAAQINEVPPEAVQRIETVEEAKKIARQAAAEHERDVAKKTRKRRKGGG